MPTPADVNVYSSGFSKVSTSIPSGAGAWNTQAVNGLVTMSSAKVFIEKKKLIPAPT